VAYTKINNAAPAFEGLRAKEHPTELWLANLDPKNPAPKRLAPNDKDFMANPAWSTDGNRIAFVRTSSFGTGAGFPTEVWSVFKDGSRLSYLTGPDVAKVGDRTIKAYPAFNLNWVGPLALAYEASTQLTGSIMLHDLSQNSDTSYVLAAEADYNSVYCPQIRRYVYTRVDTKEYKQLPGLYSVGVDKPGTATAVLLDEKGTATFGCENDTLLYKDSTGQLYVQRLNADGSANGAKVKIGFPNDEKSFIRADISPGGKYVTIEAQDNGGKVKNLGLYRADGVNVLLGSANLNFSVRDIRWPGEQILVLEGARAGNESGVLASINLTAPNPSVKLIEDISNYINLV
jgi:Tol biopolymer transport system component